jgi:hypothetical protein
MKARLPRKSAGEAIRAADWNALCDAIDACHVEVGGGGIEATHSPAGVSLFVVGSVANVFPGKTTSIVTKSSGGNYGHGTFTFRGLTPPYGIDELASSATVLSIWKDKQVASGAGIIVGQDNAGNYWLLDADDCANLS